MPQPTNRRTFRLYAPYEVTEQDGKHRYIRLTYSSGTAQHLRSKTFPGAPLHIARTKYADLVRWSIWFSRQYRSLTNPRRKAKIILRPVPLSEQPEVL
jgi:hypothetical protein